MGSLKIRLLGTVEVAVDGMPTHVPPTSRQVLAYMALRPKQAHSRAVIAGTLWGECAERNARRRLNSALWRLRRAINPTSHREYIVTVGHDNVRFNPDCDVSVDAAELEGSFEALVQQGPDSLAWLDAENMRAALASYQGPLLADCYCDWILPERRRLANVYLTYGLQLVEWYRLQGFHAEAIEMAERILQQEPLVEDAYWQLVASYAAAGMESQALAAFDRCQTVLADELGAEPTSRTLALARRIGDSAAMDVPTDETVSRLEARLEQARNDASRLLMSIDEALATLRA